MSQLKEQEKIQEKEINKMEKSNPADAEFKTLAIGMHNKHGKGIHELSENFNKKIFKT